MKLILTDDVVRLGKRGEIVNVAPGYGRNFLIPKGLAVVATEGNLKVVEQQRQAMARKEAQFRDEAEILARELEQLHLVISRKAGDTGVLFGSVTTKDLGDLLEANNFNLDRRRILLDQPVKSIGNYSIETRPHSEVSAHIELSVVLEEEDPVEKVLRKGPESDQVRSDTQSHATRFASLRAEAEAAATEALADDTGDSETSEAAESDEADE